LRRPIDFMVACKRSFTFLSLNLVNVYIIWFLSVLSSAFELTSRVKVKVRFRDRVRLELVLELALVLALKKIIRVAVN